MPLEADPEPQISANVLKYLLDMAQNTEHTDTDTFGYDGTVS